MAQIIDVNPVFLSCQVEGDALVLAHAGTRLQDGELVILGEIEETLVAIPDFERDGARYRINAFTRAGDGLLTPWERTNEGVRSPALRAGQNLPLDAVVMPICYAPVGEVSARDLADFDGGPICTPAAVKVRLPDPDDTKPDPGDSKPDE